MNVGMTFRDALIILHNALELIALRKHDFNANHVSTAEAALKKLKNIPLFDRIEDQNRITGPFHCASCVAKLAGIGTRKATNKFMICVEGGSSPTRLHETLASAEAEQDRLSKKNHGKNVDIVQVVKRVKTSLVTEVVEV